MYQINSTSAWLSSVVGMLYTNVVFGVYLRFNSSGTKEEPFINHAIILDSE